jgi:hypothetical protein
MCISAASPFPEESQKELAIKLLFFSVQSIILLTSFNLRLALNSISGFSILYMYVLVGIIERDKPSPTEAGGGHLFINVQSII